MDQLGRITQQIFDAFERKKTHRAVLVLLDFARACLEGGPPLQDGATRHPRVHDPVGQGPALRPTRSGPLGSSPAGLESSTRAYHREASWHPSCG